MTRRNVITLFTEEELRTALSLTGSQESAASIAAELYAMSPEEQVHFDWMEGTLLMLSCVSGDLARRVLDLFGSSPDDRARMQAEQASYCEYLRVTAEKFLHSPHEMEDVVGDSRLDVGLSAGIEHDPGMNSIALFTESELREALTVLGPPEEAAVVAGRVYSLNPAEQARLRWTDLALGLLAAVSRDVADRVISTFGTTPERAEEIREMRDFFRQGAHDGNLKDPRLHLDLDIVVRASAVERGD